MAETNTSSKISQLFKRLFRYFLQGLAVLAPIGVTIWVILLLFNFVDDILPNIIHFVYPTWIPRDSEGNLKKIPGTGFAVFIIIVLFVGRVSSTFFFSKMLNAFDNVLEKTPGVKFIYSSVKDFFEAFAGSKKKFDKPVLVNVDSENVWRIGFITRKDADDFEIKDHIVVYVPHSYAISGITFLVPKEKIRVLNKISAADAMKFVISGGVTDITGQHSNSD